MEASQTARADAKSRAVRKAAASLIPAGLVAGDDLQPVGQATPPVIAKGKGATLTDVDGNDYIDYRCADGAAILGHADERVVVAVNKAASKGGDLGSPSEAEVRLVELLASRYASIDMAQLFSSPTEAGAYATQLARKHTDRRHIVGFEGGPQATAHSLTIPYNDLSAGENLFREHAETIAAVMVEPVATSYGLVPPAKGYLRGLRNLCDTHGALLIFDESVVGFRLVPGGAAELFGVVGDLTILGPIVGGGLPLAACGGRREVMKDAPRLSRCTLGWGNDSQRHAGGLPNAIAIAAGTATLQAVGEAGFYEDLEAASSRLYEGLDDVAEATGVSVCHTRVGSILGVFFASDVITDFASAGRCDTELASRYFHAMLDQGVFLTPSPWPTMYVSAAHTNEPIDRTIEAAHNALRAIAKA
ncbi:MAG: aspartate aminotransferase family protein [Planctomycetota bacterium]